LAFGQSLRGVARSHSGIALLYRVADRFVKPLVVVVRHEASEGAFQLPGAAVVIEGGTFFIEW
jgi:hypothetical protein